MNVKKLFLWIAGILLGVLALIAVLAVVFPDVLILPYILYLNVRTTTTMEVHGDEIWMDGTINGKTYDQFVKLLDANPQVTTVVEGNIPGSVNDDTMIKLAYFIREQGLNTHLRSTSQINSGGVDLFLSGVERTMERGAHIGVHSWADGLTQAQDIPRENPAHKQNAQYVLDMLGSDDFYWYTIYAAPSDGMHEMSEEEIMKYGLLTQPIMEPSTDGMPGVVAAKIVTAGNPDADVVIIYSQGGPLLDLLGWGFGVYFPDVDRDKVYLVSVHQEQTLYPYNFSDVEITSEDAQAANDKSLNYLIETVHYFTGAGRKVYVVGKNYGALLVQDLLAREGHTADGYLLVAGRLDMQEEAWKMFEQGQGVKFENGVTPAPDPEFASDEEGAYASENMARLMGDQASERFTESLADASLDNVIYIYGKKDERMGRLSDDELAFLQDKDVEILATDDGYEEVVKELMPEGLTRLIGEAFMK